MVPSVSSLRPSEYDPVRQFLWADSSSSRRSIGGVDDPRAVIDRLHQFVAGGYRDVTSQAIALLGSDELNRERLEARARDEGLESALQAIRGLSARTERDETIETWELREIAQRLQRER